ncbi:hypothetical protein SPRG_19248 [Saprolegnia parasitica CBS 223.65]|uniref:Uncharacterized protein n=1 Tax=Saprolegnia parasitica (strain CBS 223.65) TaxID=695850 RepID=A0A067CSE3_SAPPC|nr:hypothetical protein SPRG_19248 [Saprolegnia parasitica CBS 223.65]KDO33624.1 hypothetical protein SPRG_19248 [Saprolegnia parasitica CBS 223.65]|eukprot:XP_012195667.1 hypothetical protein SPRG_19248 [Saprolegnia parasitica CBS 223.65]
MRVLLGLLLASASRAHDLCLRWNASTTLACNVSTPCTLLTRNTSSCVLSVDFNMTAASNRSWLGDAFERRPFLARLIPHLDNEDDEDDEDDDDEGNDDMVWRSPALSANETLPWTLWLSWGGNTSAHFDVYNRNFNSSLTIDDNTIRFPPREHAAKTPFVPRRWHASSNASAPYNGSSTPCPMILVPHNDSASGRRSNQLARNGTMFNEAYLVNFLQYLFNATRHRSDLSASVLHQVIGLLQANGSVATEAIRRFREHPPSNDLRLWSLLFTANSTQHRNATGHPVDVMRPLGDVVWQVYLESLGGWSQRTPRPQRPANATLQNATSTHGAPRNETTATITWPPASNRSSEQPTMVPFRPVTPRPSRNDSSSGSDANASSPTITVPPSDALAATGPAAPTSSSHVDAIVLSCVAVVAVGLLAARAYSRRENPEAYSNLQE